MVYNPNTMNIILQYSRGDFLNTSVNLIQRQVQKATPQTIQSLQLLSMSLVSLESFLTSLICENPLLEISDICSDYGDTTADDISVGELDEFTHYSAAKDKSEPGHFSVPPESDTLEGFLRLQLFTCLLDQASETIALTILSLISEDGYFVGTIEQITHLCKCSYEKAEKTLHLIQGFSPRGVAARTLSECLMLQTDPAHPDVYVIREILSHHLDKLSHHDIPQLARIFSVSNAHMQKIFDYLAALNPWPGSSYASASRRSIPFIIPDASIFFENEDPDIHIKGAPGQLLHLNQDYLTMMQDISLDTTVKSYLTEKYAGARSILTSLEMRYDMLKKIVVFLALYQKDFFQKGSIHIRPLTMTDTAHQLGIHPSTVSRAVSEKYIETKWGVFPMKFFFSSALEDSGHNAISSSAIKMYIHRLVKSEDPADPLSDVQLTNILCGKGINISCRTVSKYRTEENIPPRKLRKRYV